MRYGNKDTFKKYVKSVSAVYKSSSSVGVGRTRSSLLKIYKMMKDFLILVIQTDWKVAKDLATKANEKSAENVGSKTGQLIGVKFVKI